MWGDWDGDGKVGTDDSDGEVDADGNPITFEDLYGGSSHGEEYWKAYTEGSARDRKNTRIANEKKSGALLNSLVNSVGNTLDKYDQAAFDEVYGDGAYEAIQTFIRKVSDDPYDEAAFGEIIEWDPDVAEQHIYDLIDRISEQIPGISSDAIFAIIEKNNPDLFKLLTSQEYRDWLWAIKAKNAEQVPIT